MRCFALFLFLIMNMYGYGAPLGTTLANGPIHEAFIIKEAPQLVFQTVELAPPAPLNEKKPPSKVADVEWISGYWAWSETHHNFIWVSGTWRKPPPGCQWISGYWKQASEKWVWVSGFWSPIAEEQIQKITQFPPDAIDEKTPEPPNSASIFFWVAGYWQYKEEKKNFVWHAGKWENLKKEWVFVPARYIARESQFYFIPAFWDWAIEDRGHAYPALLLDSNKTQDFVYQPSKSLESLFIVEQYYPYWPDYLSFFRHHFFFHYDRWMAWNGAPIWWQWQTWWSLPNDAAWWLWWWWSHKDYPNPLWIDKFYAERIVAPPDFVLKMMQMVEPPPIVSPNGVVGQKQLFDALYKVTHKNSLLLPQNQEIKTQVQQAFPLRKRHPPYLIPKGEESWIQPILKPFFGPSKSQLKYFPERAVVPPYPTLVDVILKSTPK